MFSCLPGLHLGYVCQTRWIAHETNALLGSCVEIPCTHSVHDTIGVSGVVWYIGDYQEGEEILNTKNLSSVNEKYKNRTSMVPGEKNCTLRIDPVREEDSNTYYSDHDSSKIYFRPATFLYVRDYPADMNLSVSKYMSEDNATTVRCAVEHTCGSSPPSLQWNKPGQIEERSVSLHKGSWSEESELTYIPSYVDDGTPIRCTATYPNGQKTEKSAKLKILFAPKHVTVTIIENGKITEGSDVNLACTSISRPEVSTYEWYKGRERTKLPYKEWTMMMKDPANHLRHVMLTLHFYQ
ncbi:B-cell receptor CD22-like [Anomaloglossus baeobatrachus]|uniref:B-cell receptor CD22-like n=1 Tax=Anomaloglossus baeobatrachus TaxID=238106 RepID=UPI003F50CD1E